MQYLFDENGRRYLDAFAGIVTISCGHCHPEVLNAIMEQSKLLQHATTIYLHHAIGDFAEALASKMPGNLKVNIFSFIMYVQFLYPNIMMPSLIEEKKKLDWSGQFNKKPVKFLVYHYYIRKIGSNTCYFFTFFYFC